MEAQGLFKTYDGSQKDPQFSGSVIELDLSTVVPSVAGPKRPMDRVPLSNLHSHFSSNLTKPVSNSAFAVPTEKVNL